MNFEIEIQNLKCGGCAKTIEETLNKTSGVESTKVDLENSRINLQVSSDNTMPLVRNKLREIGYPPVGAKNSVVTKAKSYVSCATGKLKM